jgi:ribonucleoside-diphosphate reductase alpha chain
VVGETLLTTEDGLVRIGELHDGEAPDSFRDHVMAVASLDGPQKTDAFYYGGVRDVREVVLRSGHRIVGTPNHRVLVAGDAGLTWRMLHDVRAGEYVAQRYGAEMWAQVPPRFDDFTPSPRHGSQLAVTIPAQMTGELAFLLGAYVAEGHITRSNWTVTITNADEGVLARVVAAWRQFDVPARIVRQQGKCPGVAVSSKTIVEFLDHLGVGCGAAAKRIPDVVLRSPRPMVLAFLQGLALDAYTATVGTSPKWAICVASNGLLDDLQAVLTNLGIVHGRTTKHDRVRGADYDEVYASGQAARRLIRLVPFAEADKAARATQRLSLLPAASTADVVPGITPAELYALVPYGTRNADGVWLRTEFGFLADQRTTQVSRATLERVAAIPNVELPDWLWQVLDDGLHFSPVVSIDDAGEREVFDVSVPLTHAFVGNGIVNHNTVNLPEDATVEDVEQLHIDAWKLGIKAIAIYRDNCKVAQPLSVTKKAAAATALPAAAAQAPVAGMVRRKLPKQRPSQTISFQVADAKGYLTAGEYPGDGLGEIFVKLGKQGSTLSGLLDAFAISVSLGLQYGVPLEAYVGKFMNMRFEPAGMTDDTELRFSTSIVDYIARKLAIEYLPYETRAQLGIFTLDERTAMVDDGGYDQPAVPSAPTAESVAAAKELPAHGSSVPIDHDAPLCLTCGVKMQRAGACHVCESCGATSGCS